MPKGKTLQFLSTPFGIIIVNFKAKLNWCYVLRNLPSS